MTDEEGPQPRVHPENGSPKRVSEPKTDPFLNHNQRDISLENLDTKKNQHFELWRVLTASTKSNIKGTELNRYTALHGTT
jgi:hypothetical protein